MSIVAANETAGIATSATGMETRNSLGANAFYALTTMVVAATLAFLDQQAVNLVVDAIRADVGITDTQFSLLQGAAFSLVYTFAMLPIAWGHGPARSAATIAFGLAQGFAALLITRAYVAIGEAGLSPAPSPLVRDIFPPPPGRSPSPASPSVSTSAAPFR